MIRPIVYVILLGSIWTGCWQSAGEGEIKIFDDSLMVEVMTDAFILHAAFADTYGAVKDSMSEIYTNQLLEKYDITRVEFENNVDRVFENPILADSIFQLIIKRVDLLESKLDIESLDQNPMTKEED